ncbi:kinase-like domain-containing protein [Nemania sp. NC0429]|nr:kinase-like domain-containing protein [Nemania sp. NC0429]
MISRMHEHGFTDEQLPVAWEKTGEMKPISNGPGDNSKTFPLFFETAFIARDFCWKQWTFLSPCFGGSRHLTLEPNHVLPLISRSMMLKTGTFGTSQVKIHHTHLDISPKPTEKENPYIAMKQIHTRGQDKFDKDKSAIVRIHQLKHKHLIEVIGSFDIGDVYSFLLPWAESGHLEEFWKNDKQGERSPDLILWALEQMKGLASAVKELNNLIVKDSSNETGRHGDLKPENILLVDVGSASTPHGVLRITNVGLSRFQMVFTTWRERNITPRGATYQYAPPEAHSRETDEKSRLFEIWSLGCVFLEFLTWLLQGYDEIISLRNKRRIHFECDYSQFYTYKKKQFIVHPAVESHMDLLRADERCLRTSCFRDLLDVIKDMLIVDVDKRLEFPELDNRLGIIFDRARADDAYLCGL